jgi:hypothetical protein
MALIIDFVVGNPTAHGNTLYITYIYVNGKPVEKCGMVNNNGIYQVRDATKIRSITDIVDSGILQMKDCLEQANVKFRVTIHGTTLPFVYQGKGDYKYDYRYYYVAANVVDSIVVSMSIGINGNNIYVYSGNISNHHEYATEIITASMANMGITNEPTYDITSALANMSVADPRNFIYIEPRCININFMPTPNGYTMGSITFGYIHIECSFKTEHDSSWTLSNGVVTPINSDMMELNVLDFDNIEFIYGNCIFKYNYTWIENGKTYYQININQSDIQLQICLFVSLDDGYIRLYPAY